MAFEIYWQAVAAVPLAVTFGDPTQSLHVEVVRNKIHRQGKSVIVTL
jgi:hypothetical protein